MQPDGFAGTDDYSNCEYQGFTSVYPNAVSNSEFPNTFLCYENGAVSGYTGYYKVRARDKCSNVPSGYFDGHSGEMEMVEYLIPKNVLPTAEQDLVDGSLDSSIKYEDSSGWVKPEIIRYQVLHTAEQNYYNQIKVSCGNDPVKNTVAGCVTTPHNNDSYTQLGMNDLSDGYQSDISDWSSHWTIGNAGANNDNIYSPSGTVDQSTVFDGGFAGQCDTGLQWQYDEASSTWECSGALPWSHRYLVPNVVGQGEKTVGVYIKNTTFNKGTTDESLESIWVQRKGESLNVNGMDVNCFAGSSFSSGMASSKWFEKTVSVPDTVNQPFFDVTGTVNMSGVSRYTCQWSFEAVTGSGNTKTFNDDGKKPKEVGAQVLESLGLPSNLYLEDMKSVS